MYNAAQDLLEAFRSTPDTLEALLQGYQPLQADRVQAAKNDGEQAWSVLEVVCHLRDVEQRALERVQLMRRQDNPWLEAYDQAEWALARAYATTPIRAALAEFLQLRKAHLAELAALTPADWQRTGQHEEQGEITIAGHTLHLVSHDAIHLAQIARQLREGEPAHG